jgi:hypothetical protein
MHDSVHTKDTAPRVIRVQKKSYSSHPWRLVDSHTGLEVPCNYQPFDDPVFGATSLPKGCSRKSEAIEELGKMAATALPVAREALEDPAAIAYQVDSAGRALNELLGNPHAPLDRPTRQKLREDQDVLATIHRRLAQREEQADAS